KKIPGLEVMYIGTKKGLEADIVPKEGFRFETVEVESLPRSISLKTLRTAYKLFSGLRGARLLLKSFRPQVVVGTGGYVCGPVVLMAALAGIPTVIHEQNALPGITNKLLARFVKTVLVTFPESKQHFPTKAKVEVTGLPVRPGILAVSREQGVRALGLDPRKFTILVTGGSRGARSINLAVAELVQHIAQRRDVQMIVATGTATHEEFMTKVEEQGVDLTTVKNIIVKPYIYEMQEALAAADLCICRAGAAFLSELLVKGKPSILIPYPFAAENHQEHNAKAIADKGAGLLILDKDLSGERLWQEISSLLDNRARLNQMAGAARGLGKPEAMDRISEIILQVTKND
ncbi:MAG TPA: undecaprenyldiphospho-muramoylpentapeptide beta-N-acetylglucosaminyltransferase, partial [Verrucomicrobiae bacterium]|nr:undecaprenyldiphospho-muramoylpentapeptide beta-N-acetylglucosaminyltransferase [Verrucomicrobiae bacterium]